MTAFLADADIEPWLNLSVTAEHTLHLLHASDAFPFQYTVTVRPVSQEVNNSAQPDGPDFTKEIEGELWGWKIRNATSWSGKSGAELDVDHLWK